MSVINYLKSLVIKRHPRFVALGQTSEGMYFIDCYSGKVWKIKSGWDGMETFTQCMEIRP